MPRLIVIAEDNDDFRHLIAGALERVGYRVVEAESGLALVDIVRRLQRGGEPIDLIITDVRMPAVGGFDAAQEIRATGCTTPMIFMTAYSDIWSRSRASDLGAVLLDKPLSLGVLRDAVYRALAA